jgi:hypothetical protein
MREEGKHHHPDAKEIKVSGFKKAPRRSLSSAGSAERSRYSEPQRLSRPPTIRIVLTLP